MKHRLDALEGDRLFDELIFGVEDFQAEDVNEQPDWAEDAQDLESDEDDHDIDDSEESQNSFGQPAPAEEKKIPGPAISRKSKDISKKPKQKVRVKGSKDHRESSFLKSRPKLEVAKLFLPEYHESILGDNNMGFSHYMNIVAKPSSVP